MIVEDNEFIGYELLDDEFGNSALTNCGGFEDTFSPAELNHYGLLDDYSMAHDISARLRKNHPEIHHAKTNVIAIWRHRSIGRR